MKAIHIAGTKGKGSTSAFVSSILSQFLGIQPPNKRSASELTKIGLYTSPHLRFVRERIQINNKPLSEEQFTRYFFETWDRLEAAAKAAGHPDPPNDAATKPVYFRFLTLMAFHTYMSEGVDTAIIECGIGGEYDSTNILTQPVVVGITSLGIDHVGVLGPTIEEIAWHKAGIMKRGAKCFTSAGQKAEALDVLRQRASEKDVELEVVDVHPSIQSGEIKLGLQAEFQRTNASLAVAIATAWLEKQGFGLERHSFDEKIRKGLSEVHWGGRCETRQEEGIIWCIDGGHTLESIQLVGEWFTERIQSTSLEEKGNRVLIFNQQTRDAAALARALYATLASALGKEKPFTHAIFCTNTTFKETGFRPDLVSVNTNRTDVEELSVQKGLAKTWAEIDPSTEVKVVRTIEEAVQEVRDMARDSWHVTALVTGSLHLVGGFLEVLETRESSISCDTLDVASL